MSVTSPPTTPREIRLEDYRPPAWLADKVELVFELHEDHALVTSTVGYRINPDAPADPDTPQGKLPRLVLDGEWFELVSVAIDGEGVETADVDEDAHSLALTPPGEQFVLQIVTRLEPQNNTALSGLYRSGGTFCTQMEAQGFRRVTYFQDRPDVLSVYTTTITADREKFPMLLGNGNLVDSGEAPGGRHYVTWHDPHRKPCYLFALVGGDLGMVEDRFTTMSGRVVPLRIYVDKGNEARTGHAMESLKKSMRWDETAFGREYDLDMFMIVAVEDFNMGAMENKGLNIFNAALVLADPATATDADYTRIESVVGHEYFHNWSGNRVTCRDWFQLSLKEGFTVYRDQEFSSDMNSRPVQRIADVRHLRAMQFPEDAGPLAHPVRPPAYVAIDNFYTMTVYEKGAEVIRMYEALLGKQAFRKGSDLYFDRHDGEAATTDDFLAAMSQAGDIDLGQFQRWYEQAGTPRLSASGTYDAGSKVYELVLEQSCPPTPGQPEKLPMHIPLRMGLLDADGNDVPLRLVDEPADAAAGTRVFALRERVEILRFADVPCAPVPSLLRGFSAPVNLDLEQSDEQLAFLVAHDSDLFNRWEAAQRWQLRTLLALVADHRAGRELQPPAALGDTLVGLLDDDGLEPALVAEVLSLPDESVIGDQLAEVDVDAVHAARKALARRIAGDHGAALQAAYERLGPPTVEGVDTHTAGLRALKNACLDLLLASGDDAVAAQADGQLRNARTMTDQLAALEGLLAVGGPLAEGGVAWFRERWQHESLVMNKWFAAQADARRADVVEDVRRLAADPLFDAGNPNKLRALYRTFAANPVGFHVDDGRGYALLADLVLEVDKRNPIMSSRLATPFNAWRRHEPGRRALMQAQLQRILEAGELSPNLYEVASKALA